MSERVADLLSRMTREEKLAQLVGYWGLLDPETGELGPYRTPLVSVADDRTTDEIIRHGLGQLTRPFGGRPLDPARGAQIVNELQRRLVEDTRLGIPAIVHEECLTGFMAWGATAFPCPLAYGATWDPSLVERVGDAIRTQMRAVGAHQGLAPVLDVVRDPRWGRVEECIAEDPYLVGCVGTAYVRGLQGDDLTTGVVATTKHFAGHSFSEGGRNLAPAHVGPREMADVFLLPFEMAVKDGGVRSVMNAYQENDGVPAAASRELLTEILRDRWGFDGIVVSDYFSVGYLHALHGVTAGQAESAAAALHAGIDVELPSPDCYGAPLADAIDRGLVADADLDRAVERMLRLKEELGLFERPYVEVAGTIDVDPPEHRALAYEVAIRSIVLLKNDGVLPLTDGARLAVIGPNAASGAALLGNYSFENHVAAHFPDAPPGVAVATIADALSVAAVHGCDVTGDDGSGIDEAVAAAEAAEVAVVVVGDHAGHFGGGTSGEGTDTDDLALPGLQQQLVEAVVGTGTPTVVVLVVGRPYDVQWIAEHAAAVVGAWFPGEEGGTAVADVLLGRVNPSGKTPVTFGRGAGQQPFPHLHKPLSRVGYSRSSTRPVFPFGHGLSYTTFEYGNLTIEPAEVPVDGDVVVSCTVCNTGGREGEEVVQLYVRDPVASVTRPLQELRGFARVALEPGAAACVRFTIPADVLSFTGVDLRRVVEPGRIDVTVGASSEDGRLHGAFTLVGDVREVGERRRLTTGVAVEPRR